jgi:hypothetical protein
LAAGINLPARSVVLTSLVKGPFGKERLIEPSVAHQIFGRAGRPQFDDRGFVFALAHEDDVKLLRWKEKYDAIPDSTRDPGLIKAKKALKKKKPTRSDTKMYWQESQFKGLQGARPGKLFSKGPLPWRLLAYLLKVSPDVARVRTVIRKRLLDEPRIKAGEAALERMLLTLARGGFVKLEPEPPPEPDPNKPVETPVQEKATTSYSAVLANPTAALDNLLVFRSIHPLYGAFLLDHLGIASREEGLQALESVLEIPRPVLRFVRVPRDLAPGPLATSRLDAELIRRGLMTARPPQDSGDPEEEAWEEDEERPPSLAEKLYLLFEATHPEVWDVRVQSVWAAGELLRFGGNFNKFVQSRDLVKQEGIVFRHLLRLILLLGEMSQVCPLGTTADAWQAELRGLAEQLTVSCREVDPQSTDEMIELAHAADVVEGEVQSPPPETPT